MNAVATPIPIYDDNKNSIVPILGILEEVSGQQFDVGASREPKDDLYFNSPVELVQFLTTVSADRFPKAVILDVHDPEFVDLSAFGLPDVVTENGWLTGWMVAKHVIVPKIVANELPNLRIFIVSSHSDSLDAVIERAKATHFAPDIEIEFFRKPTALEDEVADSLRSELRLVVEEPPASSNKASGSQDTNQDLYLKAIGMQLFWDLTDEEMAAILGIPDHSDFDQKIKNNADGSSEMPKTHIQALWELKTVLSGSKRKASPEERKVYERQWLRYPRSIFGDLSPLELLLRGRVEVVALMISVLKGNMLDPKIWGSV